MLSSLERLTQKKRNPPTKKKDYIIGTHLGVVSPKERRRVLTDGGVGLPSVGKRPQSLLPAEVLFVSFETLA